MLLLNQQQSYPQNDVYGALRLALIDLFGVEVVKGLSNRVPQPLNDYIAMQPLMVSRLSTNGSNYPIAPDAEITRQEKLDSDYQIQLDFYGTNSSNMAMIFFNLMRSDYLFQYGIKPMFTSEPRQLTFVGGNYQMTERWSIDAHLAYTPVVNLPQQSANTLQTIFHPVIG